MASLVKKLSIILSVGSIAGCMFGSSILWNKAKQLTNEENLKNTEILELLQEFKSTSEYKAAVDSKVEELRNQMLNYNLTKTDFATEVEKIKSDDQIYPILLEIQQEDFIKAYNALDQQRNVLSTESTKYFIGLMTNFMFGVAGPLLYLATCLPDTKNDDEDVHPNIKITKIPEVKDLPYDG